MQRQRTLPHLPALSVVCSLLACGKFGHHSKHGDEQTATKDISATQTENASPTKPAFECRTKKTPPEFVTTLTQDLFRRGPTTQELAMAQAGDFDPAKVVDWAFTQSDYDTGIAYFVSNLLRIEQNLKLDPNVKDAEEIALLSDLKQEPVVLVQKNKDKPWSYMFTTQDIYCSSRTAKLYGFPVDSNISGFVKCKMQDERAGLLGLVSVLRAFKSAFYVANSNRHRVSMALYLAQGLQLAAKTDGPTGDGKPMPLAACVPEIDTRVSTSGLIFGTAAVPKAGAVCAGCHSKYLAPMEPAFLRFGMNGETLNLDDVDNLQNNMLEGIPKETLKDILAMGGNSCWAPDDPLGTPEYYTGLPGLARLIAGSKKLGQALAVQIQQNLVNRTPDDAATESIIDSYENGGKTLQSALRGYFLSDPYQCAKRAD